MIQSLTVSIAAIGGIFVGVIIWDGSNASVLFSSLAGSSYDTSLASCDHIKILLSDFNSISHSLGMVTNGADTHTNIPVNNNPKKFFNYWLYGTATNTNWFDAYCQTGWDYVKGNCNIIPTSNSKEIFNYWLYGTPAKNNWFDAYCQSCWDYVKDIYNITQIGSYLHEASSEQFELWAKADYFVFGLARLLIVYFLFHDFYYNLDTLYAAYTNVDLQMYNFLCMFDFPGFLVHRNSIMNLGGFLAFQVNHSWNFLIDPADGMFHLCHLATYTLHHEYFWFDINLLTPSWSMRSYVTLTVVPDLSWPLNYDHHHEIKLFELF